MASFTPKLHKFLLIYKGTGFYFQIKESHLSNDQILTEVKEYKSRPLREALLAGGFVFCIVFINSYFIHHWAMEAQKGEIGEGIARAGDVIATMLDIARHNSYRNVEQMKDPEYQADHLILQRVIETGAFVYCYTTIMQQGKILFILDGSPPGDADSDGVEDSVSLMEVYTEPSQDLLKVFETHKPVVSQEPYHDKWGAFISAYVPLFDKDGQFAGVLGIDISADNYYARLAPITRAAQRAYVNGFFVAFMVGCIVWFLRKFILVINTSRLSIHDRLKAEIHSREK